MAALTLGGLEGKVAVVTGAGRMRSAGREIAVLFSQAGCDVVLTDIASPAATLPQEEAEAGWRDVESVAEEIRANGSRALPVVSDVSNDVAVRALLKNALATFGRVDFVINNAAAPLGADRAAVTDLVMDALDTVIRVNLRGTFLMSKVFGQHLVEANHGGAIVNISSISARRPPPKSAAYAASKLGIIALTESMAQEVGPYGIRVNAICPGAMDTNRAAEFRNTPQWAEMVKRIPLGRASSGADIAWAAVFLCSEQGSWITGQAISVDGGMSVQQ